VGIISIPVLRSWYSENPIPPMDLGMFRFMVILTSYFTMAKNLGWATSQNAWGGDQANWKSTTTAQPSVKMLLTTVKLKIKN